MKKAFLLFLTIVFAASFAFAQGQQLKTFHFDCPGDEDDPNITYTGYEDELGNITKHGQYKRYGISVNFKNGKLNGVGTISESKTTATLKYVNDKLVSIDYIEKGTGSEIIIFKYSLDDNGLLKGDFEFKQICSYDNSLVKGKFDEEGKATGWWEFKAMEDKDVSKKYYEHGYCLGTDDKTIETSRAYFIDKKLTEKELLDKGFYVITDNPKENAEIGLGNAINMVQNYLCGKKYGFLENHCLNLHFKNIFNLENIFNHTLLGGTPITNMSSELYQNIVNQIKNNDLQIVLKYDMQLDKFYALKADGVSRLYMPIESENEFKGLFDGPCPSTMKDYDGNTYNTVKIGTQCWMKENLKTTHYSDGTEITSRNGLYNPNGNDDEMLKYGYLYNWYAVMHEEKSRDQIPSHVQGICPMGWHVPSVSEWDMLIGNISKPEYECNNDNHAVAKSLAATREWNNSDNLCDVGNLPLNNNATGFSAIPVGYGSHALGTYFDEMGKRCYFWSSTESDNYYSFGRVLQYNNSYVQQFRGDKSRGYSVRCLKD